MIAAAAPKKSFKRARSHSLGMTERAVVVALVRAGWSEARAARYVGCTARTIEREAERNPRFRCRMTGAVRKRRNEVERAASVRPKAKRERGLQREHEVRGACQSEYAYMREWRATQAGERRRPTANKSATAEPRTLTPEPSSPKPSPATLSHSHSPTLSRASGAGPHSDAGPYSGAGSHSGPYGADALPSAAAALSHSDSPTPFPIIWYEPTPLGKPTPEVQKKLQAIWDEIDCAEEAETGIKPQTTYTFVGYSGGPLRGGSLLSGTLANAPDCEVLAFKAPAELGFSKCGVRSAECEVIEQAGAGKKAGRRTARPLNEIAALAGAPTLRAPTLSRRGSLADASGCEAERPERTREENFAPREVIGIEQLGQPRKTRAAARVATQKTPAASSCHAPADARLASQKKFHAAAGFWNAECSIACENTQHSDALTPITSSRRTPRNRVARHFALSLSRLDGPFLPEPRTLTPEPSAHALRLATPAPSALSLRPAPKKFRAVDSSWNAESSSDRENMHIAPPATPKTQFATSAPENRWSMGEGRRYISGMKTLPDIAEMQRAYQQRDAAYNGLFVLGVRTTGVFCRPTCPARKPLPRNVEYFGDAKEALAAGYRPCKRCRPMDDVEHPAWVRQLLTDVEAMPAARIREGDIAARGIDPATARRYFLRHFGMTFQAYARSRRLTQSLKQIREGSKLDTAVFASGYESHSGFRDAFARTFGNPPGKAGGGDCVLLAWLQSPLGPLVAGATADGVCLLEFTDRRMLETQFATVRKLFKCPAVPGMNAHLERLQDELSQYFAGTLRRFTVPLTYPGTPFQQRVWDELLRIPYGETRSYEELALAVGSPGAQRAVGRANGLNRIGIVIPCHRVVNKSGELGGYGGGLHRKRYLLEMERSNAKQPLEARTNVAAGS